MEISALKAAVGELRSRIDVVDDSATSLIVAGREEAATERKATLDERLVLASQNLSRFQLVNKALSEEKDARLEAEARLRIEVEKMAAAIGDAMRDADTDHAGLVEAVHKRIVARLAQQEDVSFVVQEALENKRAFLEDVVRAEIATRFAGMEEMKSQAQSRHAECKKELEDRKDEIKADLQLLHVKTKANARSIRNQSAVVESVRSQSEQLRADVVTELLSVTKAQAQAEEQSRAKMQAQAHDVRQQLSALHETMQNLQGQEDKSQERRDLDQDKEIEKLSDGLSSAHTLIAGLNAESQQLASILQKSCIERLYMLHILGC